MKFDTIQSHHCELSSCKHNLNYICYCKEEHTLTSFQEKQYIRFHGERLTTLPLYGRVQYECTHYSYSGGTK